MYPVKSDYLFVYSSLLKGFPTPDYEYISRYFNFVGPAKARGRLSVLNDIVVGTPADTETFIKGELYKIRGQDLFSFAIGQLDEYEGVHPEPPQQSLYRRAITLVILEDGTEISSWVYWYNGGVEGLPVIDSGDILDFLKRKNNG